MFSSSATNQSNPRHYPANPSLNKNADGFVCCINMNHNDISKSRTESRLEYFLQGKPKSSNLIGGNLGIGGWNQQTTQPLFGQSQTQQQTSTFGGLNQFGQQQPQPTTIFGQTQQPQQAGGLFSTSQQPSTIFGGQQQTQAQTGGLFGSTPPSGSGGLFGGSLGNQSTQPQTGGLFTSLQTGNPQQPAGGGLFGQPQQQLGGFSIGQQPLQQAQPGQNQLQPSGLLFGQGQDANRTSLFGTPALNTNNTPTFGAPSLFGSLGQPSPAFGTPAIGQPAQLVGQVGPTIQQPFQQQYYNPSEIPSVQLNLNLDYNELSELESLHLKEIEQKFNSGMPSMNDISYKPQVYNINLSGQRNIRINVNEDRASQRNSKMLLRQSINQGVKTSQINQKNLQQSDYIRQSMNRQQQREITMNQQMLERSQQVSHIKEDTSPMFTLSQILQGRTITRLVSFNQIGFVSDENSKVQDFKEALVKYLYKNTKRPSNYMIIDHYNNVSKMRKDQDPLSLIKFNGNKTIITLDCIDETIGEEDDQESEEISYNQSAPVIESNSMTTIPSIQILQKMDDLELSHVEDFVVETRFGRVNFLEPVDLRDLQLDKIIVFTQDSVEFFPEECGVLTPEKGNGINVRCQITFFRFGDASKKMKAVRQSDFNEYKQKVISWAESLDMDVVSIEESGEVKVILEEI